MSMSISSQDQKDSDSEKLRKKALNDKPAQADNPQARDFLVRLKQLRHDWDGKEDRALITKAFAEFKGRLAVESSFGAESVVELHMISQINPDIPIIFLNTGKLFGETLRYRDQLQSHLGLRDVRSFTPDEDDQKKLDPKGILWNSHPDLCCHFRKTLPHERALEGFEAVITGRKRFQTKARQNMPLIELVERAEPFYGFRFVLNPLADWTFARINAYIEKYQLPRHPLVKDGYLSIGCMPCTKRSSADNYREGRWVGRDKEECGIHQNAFSDGDGI